MEDIFSTKILNELSFMYQSKDENKTLKIFFLRCMIYHLTNQLTNELIITFLYRELNFKPNSNIIFFNKIINKYYYGYEDSIESIIDNWKFEILEKSIININNERTTTEHLLKNQYKIFFTYAKKQLKGLSKEKYYEKSLKHIMLLQLYSFFNILYIEDCRTINGISSTNINEHYISIDLEYKRYYNELFYTNIQYERGLEDFLYYKYNKSTNKLLFDDIVITNRQYKVKSGIIDLLGKDSNGNIVIIELKVVKRPIDIFYQLKAYTNNIKDEFKTNNVRFIAITPKLSNDIYEELLTEEISIYNYKKNGNNFTFNQIK